MPPSRSLPRAVPPPKVVKPAPLHLRRTKDATVNAPVKPVSKSTAAAKQP